MSPCSVDWHENSSRGCSLEPLLLRPTPAGCWAGQVFCYSQVTLNIMVCTCLPLLLLQLYSSFLGHSVHLTTGPCGRGHLALALLTIIKRDRYASECPLRKFATVFSQLKTHYGRQMWYQNDQKSVKFNKVFYNSEKGQGQVTAATGACDLTFSPHEEQFQVWTQL